MSRTSPTIALAIALVAGVGTPLAPARAEAPTGSITGVAFVDANRNGVRDAGEGPMVGNVLYAFDGSGAYAGQATTDATGRYEIAGLRAGEHRIRYAPGSWSQLRQDWVTTTSSALKPDVAVTVPAPDVDFGWRTIVRSRSLGSPLSAYRGQTGLLVESYNDAVSAQEVHDTVLRGAVGQEASSITIRFDYSDVAMTSAGWQGSPGSYSNYSAVCYNNWITWVEQGDWGVSHEYGHAWARYFDTVVQQDGALARYLRARGLEGDPRVRTAYEWNPDELIAEDYRQLLGSPTARVVPQANRDLPRAADVPGLAEFLSATFQQPPPTAPPAATPLSVTAVAVTPSPVTKSGTVEAMLSVAASVTVDIRDSRGTVIRTILAADPRPAGRLSVVWDRKTAAGRRVAAGTYTATVVATAAGSSVTTSTSFPVA